MLVFLHVWVMEYRVLFIDRPPLSWSSLITHCLWRIEKRTQHSLLIYPVLETQNCFFVIFLNGYMFDLRFSWTDFLWTSITEHYKKQCLLWYRCHVFFKLLCLQVKNVLLSPKNINSYGFSLQSFEIIVSLKLIEMWTVMFTKGGNNIFFLKISAVKEFIYKYTRKGRTGDS